MITGTVILSQSELIIKEVAAEFCVTIEALKGLDREKEVVLARHVAMYFLRQKTGLTLQEVGNILDGRTPATVSHGYQKIAQLRERKPSRSSASRCPQSAGHGP